MKSLKEIAKLMTGKGKGILAADESNPTCKKRFDSIGVQSTFENRNEYRDLLFSAEGMENYIGGVIMFDETFHQTTTCDQKKPFPAYLREKGVVAGIKVDKGTKNLAGFNDEQITEGLDGLRERLINYYNLGARFAKWRGVIKIGDNIPSKGSLQANMHSLARYAALCQESGLVPIVEPEVLMDGRHTIEKCYEVTELVLQTTFGQLDIQRVLLDCMVLKPNMVISAIDCSKQAPVNEVADMTLRCLKNNVPSDVAGIAFLSGGQSSNLATAHLNAMNLIDSDLPWNLTFSYGRALQQDALNSWQGYNRKEAQDAFLYRAKNNSLASKGKCIDCEIV
ncbi:MAG: fructose-bisphosphate aldolase class I [Pelagibacteraceae bacterium TMED124]|nr:fructose-bisphosphate aldolase class I [Candidatus Neomarinimicrobiota bacterium]RPG19307.1 MAG: fructose-bisphosphate aldolase class I [Pelagibacteraceae bacterium TMED124]|tara:strand:- start:3796 stop:4806 length:1011 start_codon:yes stop_codon:yes gene_type:complete